MNTTYVDLYCERLGPGLFAEPLNAITNAAFLIAGIALWRLADRSNVPSPDVKILSIFAIAIGIGSGMFHTLATPWSRILDVTPILLFQLLFVWFYARQGMDWGRITAGMLSFSVLSTSLIARNLPQLLSGSLNYLPAVAVILILGLYHRIANKPSPYLLLIAGGLFCLSLLIRTFDSILCPQIPLGIHFLWHIINAVVLYLCGRTLIELRREQNENF